MTLVTDALNRVARQVSVDVPSSWLTATSLEHSEIRDDFMSETVEDILDRVDLPSPISAETTITGTGVETYSLPSTFRRMHRDPLAVYDVSLQRPLVPVSTDGRWEDLQEWGASGVTKFYQVTGYDGAYSISIYSFPSTNITVHYVTNYWAATAAGSPKTGLTLADDILLLPRKLFESGIVYRWRERKGLPAEDKRMEYEFHLARLINDTRGRRSVNMGDKRAVRWQDLIPAEIPSS